MAAAHAYPCPYCGQPVPAGAPQCRSCGRPLDWGGPAGERQWIDEGDDERRGGRPRQDVEATDFLVPVNVSPWALASCYLGLIGFCLPIIGLVFAIPALIFGIIALQKKPARRVSYGSVTG